MIPHAPWMTSPKQRIYSSDPSASLQKSYYRIFILLKFTILKYIHTHWVQILALETISVMFFSHF